MDQNKTGSAGHFSRSGKYLKYAIGEIVLIVFSILLALYLNNLNTKSQQKKEEVKVLNEIKSNLFSSILSFERTINTETDYLNQNKKILEYIDNNKPYSTELDHAFGVYFWTISSNPITVGYEYLKSRGIELITNDSLRNNISFMFENEFAIIKNENELWANNLQQNITYPYHVNHFIKYFTNETDSLGIEYAKPFDYDALISDKTFKSINTEIISNRRWNIKSLGDLVIRINDLIQQIDNELKRKK
jgi:hypothetical protein